MQRAITNSNPYGRTGHDTTDHATIQMVYHYVLYVLTVAHTCMYAHVFYSQNMVSMNVHFNPQTLSLYSSSTFQSSKPSGVIPLLQLYRIFDARTAGISLSYCVGLEGAGGCYLHYLKAETPEIYNAWLRVRWRDNQSGRLGMLYVWDHVTSTVGG